MFGLPESMRISTQSKDLQQFKKIQKKFKWFQTILNDFRLEQLE